MKIGIYNPYLDDLGGGEKYMMTIAECLSKKHEVTVFWENKGDVGKLLQRFSLDLSRVAFTKNIFSPQISVIERILATRKFDVIIVLSDGSIPFVLSKKLLLHFQQPMPHLTVRSFKEKFKLSRVTAVFCNSFFTKSFIDKALGIKSIVIYPPVDTHSKKIKKENIILTVGRLRVKDVTINGVPLGDYKKQTVMIEAFKEMQSKLKGWRFILGISVQDEDRKVFNAIQKMTEGLPIELMVNKSNKELWNLYNKAKIYWHAAGYGADLNNHPEYAEHFGISTVEAMGGGAVPIVFNAGGQREIVQDGVNGLRWNSLKELQDKTLWVINSYSDWQRLSESAKASSKSYSKRRFCEAINKLIES